MTTADILKILLADIAKAPLILSDVQALKTAAEKLLTDSGFPIPWAGVAVAHDEEFDAVAHKLGDGLLKGLQGFLQSPAGLAILQVLLGKLFGGTAA